MGIVKTKTLDPDHPGKLLSPRRVFTSRHVKASLFAYFRFSRGYLCADEVALLGGRCDLLVDTGRSTIEVEVKMTKHDLYSGELKKDQIHGKHSSRNIAKCPNYFYVCVPQELRSAAVAWTDMVDKRYGVMVFTGWRFLQMSPDLAVAIQKPAQELHSTYHNYRDKIAMRLCSAAATRKIKECRNG